MDSSFQFPRHTAPIPRPAPRVTAPSSSTNRESNALRASVLDVALELGIGHNSTVMNWMFNNSLTEEDEEELRSPSLTHESPVTSEESSPGRSPVTPLSSHPQPSFQSIPAKLFPVQNHSDFDKYVDKQPDRLVTGGGITFSNPPPPSRPTTPSRGKLKKKRGDGYESDGGYMSDGGKKKKEREKEAKERAKEEKQQEKREKEERKRSKSIKVKKRENKDGYATGYDTDGASKRSKGKAGDGDYETDSGYISSTSTKGKSKGRFFGLKSRQSKADLPQEGVPSMPVLDKNPVALPIASKFATTIDTGPLMTGESLNSMISKAMDGPMASVFSPSSVTTFPSSISTSSPHPTSRTSFSPTSRESLGSTESSGSMSASASSLSHSHSKRRGFQFHGQDLVPKSGGGSHVNATSPSQIALHPSAISSPSSATQSSQPISLPNTHRASIRNPTPIETSVEAFSEQDSPSHSSKSPPSAFSPVQHSSSNSLGNPRSEFSPVHHSSSNSLNSPSVFTPQIFPTARNPSLSRGPSVTRAQLPQSAASGSVSLPEPDIPLSPVPVLSTQHVDPLLSATAQSTRIPAPVAVQPRISPTIIAQSLRLPSRTPTSPSRPSPTTAIQALRPRPRNPPTDGFGPRPILSPSIKSPSFSDLPSPSPTGSQQSLTIIPSTDYIVPSPHPSPLPLQSPSVLAYYDIPPPSPPPSGPLPKIPPPLSVPSRSKTLERPTNGAMARSRTPEPRPLNQPIPSVQRGRESPFPPRPVLPQTRASNVISEAETDFKIPMNREFHGSSLPKGKNDQVVEQREVDKARDWMKERDSVAKRSSDGSWDAIAAYGGDDDDDEEEDMRDVLDRFEEAKIDMEIDALQSELNGGNALGRNRSFEAIEKRITGRYEDDQDLEYRDDGDGEIHSRWSGTMSIYSRASVLDPEKSEEARQRFIKRVEDLYGDGGREKIPPVPKIPDAFIDGPAQGWTRF
ncbi:hypothetical protein C0993_010836 [Termitomyces sp. T159_Od127]|nr:hypothetical protein C0993_010836 [Termitomyces sp. T159_Od127]